MPVKFTAYTPARVLYAALLFAASAPAADSPPEIAAPPWFVNSFLDLREDIREAAAANKRVMIYFGQNGCPYCRKLMEVNFRQPDIVAKMRRHFAAIEINIFGSREVIWIDGRARSEKEFAALLGVQFTPTLLFLDPGGNIALRVNGYYPPQRFHAVLDSLAQGSGNSAGHPEVPKENPGKAGSGAPPDEPFFRKPPYAFDRRKPASRPLAVFFEQRNCPDCDELHATALKAGLTRQLLSRFEVYRLDLHGNAAVTTPAGVPTTAAQWARDLGVTYTPSVVFFDVRGAEVFRVESYVRAFHLQSALDYIASRAYLKESSFQRYIQARAAAIRARGGRVEIMN